jgi:hypothetical protein
MWVWPLPAGQRRREVALKKLSWPLIILILVVLALAAWGLTHTERPMAGLTYVGLVSGCRLEAYDAPLQPRLTLRLACPGQDWIQLWPLPKIERAINASIDRLTQQLNLGEAINRMIPRFDVP